MGAQKLQKVGPHFFPALAEQVYWNQVSINRCGGQTKPTTSQTFNRAAAGTSTDTFVMLQPPGRKLCRFCPFGMATTWATAPKDSRQLLPQKLPPEGASEAGVALTPALLPPDGESQNLGFEITWAKATFSKPRFWKPFMGSAKAHKFVTFSSKPNPPGL